MKNLTQKVSALFFALLLFLSSGCSDFLDINTDPNAATSVEADLLFPTTMAQVASNRIAEFAPQSAFFSQIWVSNGSTPTFMNPETYTISSNTTNNLWVQFYTDGMKNMTLAIDQAESSDPVRNNVAAQAKILKSYFFYTLTTVFGPIPYTQAVNPEFPEPEFDDQETILRGLVQDLTNAADQIDKSSDLKVTDGDLMYKGDMDKWEMFANSLKLRILMMIRNRDDGVDSQIQTLLDNEPLIRSNADNAAFPFYETTDNENNLWKLMDNFGGFTNAGNGNIFISAGEPLVSLMKDLGDPRLGTYFAYSTDDDGNPNTTEYNGQEAGVEGEVGDHISTLHQNILRETFPSRVVTAAEVLLYEAEYYALQGNMDDADDKFEAGVRAGIDWFDGKDGEISEGDEDTYVSSLPDLTTSGQSAALEAIREQQYIEVFERAPENWNHWKRTKVPNLSPPQNGTLGNNLIHRLSYPTSEISSNSNVPEPVPQNSEPMWFEN